MFTQWRGAARRARPRRHDTTRHVDLQRLSRTERTSEPEYHPAITKDNLTWQLKSFDCFSGKVEWFPTRDAGKADVYPPGPDSINKMEAMKWSGVCLLCQVCVRIHCARCMIKVYCRLVNSVERRLISRGLLNEVVFTVLVDCVVKKWDAEDILPLICKSFVYFFFRYVWFDSSKSLLPRGYSSLVL